MPMFKVVSIVKKNAVSAPPIFIYFIRVDAIVSMFN